MGKGSDPAGDVLATVRDILTGEDDGHAAATFVRGLTLGALIGAAIAGSAIWRRRERPAKPVGEPRPAGTPDR